MLSVDKIFKLMDERFKEKNILYRHNIDSYNNFLDRLIKYLENTKHTFNENKSKNLITRHYFDFKNVKVKPLTKNNNKELILPTEAKIKDITYSIDIVCSIKQYMEVFDLVTEKVVTNKIISSNDEEIIMRIPNMVKSKTCASNIKKDVDECLIDPGGYFIVNGGEKLMLSIETMCMNKPLVIVSKKGTGKNTVIIYKIQIHSISNDLNLMMQKTQIILKKDNTMVLNVPLFQEVSIFVILRALGFVNDMEIVNYITFNNNDIEMIKLLEILINKSKYVGNLTILTEDDAYNFLVKKVKVHEKYTDKENDKDVLHMEKKEHIKMLFTKSFIPHLNNINYDNILKAKGIFICYMINKLLNYYLGRTELDDRDSCINKRIITAGDTMLDIIVKTHKKMLNECNKIFWKSMQGSDEVINIINSINYQKVFKALTKTLSTSTNENQTGLAMRLERISLIQSLAYLRSIISSDSSESMSKLIGPRMFHPSQMGFIDATESPEHKNIGLTKHLSLLSLISVEVEEQTDMIYNELITNKLFTHFNNHTLMDLFYGCKIFLNGNWVGFTEHPIELYNHLKILKEKNVIEKTNGITYNFKLNEIKIYTDSGRLYRPLLNVKNNEILLNDDIIDDILNLKVSQNINKWNLLISKYPEVISFVDVEEQFFTLISSVPDKIIEMKKRETNIYEDSDKMIVNRYDKALILKYSHCEINPVFTMGIISGRTIFANYNICTRNIFQYAQGKQVMSIYATNWKNRLDISYMLYYPQQPIVYSKIEKYVKTDMVPCGENIVLLIDCYTGSNQDDSLIFNKSFIERGGFRSTNLKKYKSTTKKNQVTAEDNSHGIPDKSKLDENESISYDKLTVNGYPLEETEIFNGEAIIGKTSPIEQAEGSDKTLKDSSIIYKGNTPMVIDKVYANIKNGEGYNMIGIRGRIEKKPKIGDKFCFPVDKTEILTLDGWKKINEITMNDYISILNDGNIEYEKPKGIFIIPYNGLIHKIKNNSIDLDITVDHKLYVKQMNEKKYKLMDSSKVYKTKYNMKKDGLYCIEHIKNKQLINGTLNYDNFLEILGLYINYGSIGDLGYVIFNFKNKEIIEYFKEVLQKLKINIDKYNNLKILNTESFKIKHTGLYYYFQTIDKNILPTELLNLNYIQSEIFLKSLYYNLNNNFLTNSQNIVDNLTIIGIHSGLSTNTMYDSENDMFVIELFNDKENAEPFINDNNETMYEYDGMVGCLEVSSHVFMVRQGNKYIWSGNCCYTEDHEIMTFDGWKAIDKITIEDKIACLENENEIIYKNPKEVMTFEYNSVKDGKLYEVDNYSISLRVTPNHRMYVSNINENKYKMELAENIYGIEKKYKNNADKYLITNYHERIKYKNGNPEYFILKKNNREKNINLNDWCYFYGLWFSCGFVDLLNENIVIFKFENNLIKKKILDIIKRLNIIYDNSNDNFIIINNKYVCNYFKSNNDKNKLPDWYKYLSKEQSISLIKGIIMIYNISINNNNNLKKIYHYSALSLNLINEIQQLSIHGGFSTKYYKYINKKSVNELDKYKYSIIISNNKDDYNNLIVNKNVKLNLNNDDKFEDFNGKVYCCRMYDDYKENDGIVLIRRNGKIVWSGQSRSGQKGTIGLILHASQMPFTKDGIVPDIIMNPQAFPTRMSFAQLLENALGKIGAIKGIEIDGTPFNNIDFNKDIMQVLGELGYNTDSTEEFYDGFSGRKIKKPLTVGINYYHRLKHLVDDKVYSRSLGSSTIVTRQPLEGRSKNGGGRLGEMERDALITHGNSFMLKERLLDMSDIYTTHVCDICGLFAQRINKIENNTNPSSNDSFECKICRNQNKISQIKIPYSAKLMFQELLSMNIAPRIRTENYVERITNI